jgi:hypothetical protein
MYTLFIILIVLAVLWSALSFYFEKSIEMPKFSLLEKKNGYEIRHYEPYLTAQVEVTGTYTQASTQGFKILANYIFGNNLKDVNLSMSSNTIGNRKPASEKMSMTAPVMENKVINNNTRIISFVMPSKYTKETLPKPNNPQVKIVPIPSKKMAVLTYSWYATESRVENKKRLLLLYLKRDSLLHSPEIQTARYNAPFNPPWMNRNEILTEINTPNNKTEKTFNLL